MIYLQVSLLWLSKTSFTDPGYFFFAILSPGSKVKKRLSQQSLKYYHTYLSLRWWDWWINVHCTSWSCRFFIILSWLLVECRTCLNVPLFAAALKDFRCWASNFFVSLVCRRTIFSTEHCLVLPWLTISCQGDTYRGRHSCHRNLSAMVGGCDDIIYYAFCSNFGIIHIIRERG